MKKKCVGRWMALALGLLMACSLSGLSEEAQTRYGQTKVKGVNMRGRPSGKADVVHRLPITGTAVRIDGDATDEVGQAWYQVEAGGETGYIRADLLEEISAEAYAKAQQKPTAAPRRKKANSGTADAPASAHSGYPPATPVWVASGVYHSDTACPRLAAGSAMTLGAAQGQGLEACTLCWCYDCLYAAP